MDRLIDVLAPLTWGICALAALASLTTARSPQALAPRRLAAFALALASALLLLACVEPRLLPVAASMTRPDGTTHDPRITTAIVLAAAATVSLFDGLGALELPPIRMIGALMPGALVATLLASVLYFVGLRQPLGVAALATCGFAIGTAFLLGTQLTADRARSFACAQALGVAVLAAGATLSLFGARTNGLPLREGAAVDTLGMRVSFERTDAPNAQDRLLHFTLDDGKKRIALVPEVHGTTAQDRRSIAAGRFGAGPVVIASALHETRDDPHRLLWLKKGESLQAGDARLTFTGFRMVAGDTIRVLADLRAEHGGRTETVSPGMYATKQGEIPFPVTLAGVGMMTVARVDADGGRVALLLPNADTGARQRLAMVDLRLRPGLPLAWFGGALALLMALLAFGAPAPEARRH